MSKLKKNFDINYILDAYNNQRKTITEIGKEFGVSYSTMNRYFQKNNIPIRKGGFIKGKAYNLKPTNKQEIKDIERLKELFNSCIPCNQIAKELNVSPKAVYRTIKELNLIRPKSMMKRDFYNVENDADYIRLYIEGKSTTEIARQFNVSHRTVLQHLKHCGVQRRNISNSLFNYNNKVRPKELDSFETMYELYVNQHLSKKAIADSLHVAPDVIHNVLLKFKIPIRNVSECKIGLMAGPKHPNWQGGKVELSKRIREFFHTNQTQLVLKRDGYKCCLCGSHKHLHVHHIQPFKELFDTILKEHKDLNIETNKEELYEIMTKDERMTNLNNLITYCQDCHRKIHSKPNEL